MRKKKIRKIIHFLLLKLGCGRSKVALFEFLCLNPISFIHPFLFFKRQISSKYTTLKISGSESTTLLLHPLII